MGHLNVEIKARCHNLDEIKQYLMSRDATFKGDDHQVDTYFNCHFGRLKLREGNIENYLIQYDRENIEGPKKSEVRLYEPKNAHDLKQALTAALGVLAVVDKKRLIYFIDNVKFHLDRVMGLGTFVEIEAIDYKRILGEDYLQEQCSHYKQALHIRDEDRIHCSYSDLLLGNSPP
jgi:adenylate cyclase, class 2